MWDSPSPFDGGYMPRRRQDQMETAIFLRMMMCELVAEQEPLDRRGFVIFLADLETESAWSCATRRTLVRRLPRAEHLVGRAPLLLGGELIKLTLRRPRIHSWPRSVAKRKILRFSYRGGHG
jgi:hypothetical protein